MVVRLYQNVSRSTIEITTPLPTPLLSMWLTMDMFFVLRSTVQSSEHGVSMPGITHRTHLCKDSFPSKRYCRVYITVLSAIVYILRRITCIKHGCTRYAWRGLPTLGQTVPEERKDKSWTMYSLSPVAWFAPAGTPPGCKPESLWTWATSEHWCPHNSHADGARHGQAAEKIRRQTRQTMIRAHVRRT